MIALREWLRRRRTSLRVALALATVLGALIWAHSGGEQHPIPGEHLDDGVVAMCLAVLNVGAALTAVGAFKGLRRRHALPVVHRQRPARHDSLARMHTRLPPPRAGPRELQVFLR